MAKLTVDQIAASLAEVHDQLGRGPVLLHTDIARLGIPDGVRGRDNVLKTYHDLLTTAFRSREIAVPTFNYSFPKSRVYDVANDPAEVGMLNDYFRLQHPEYRTNTPVFNFTILNSSHVDLSARANPLDRESTFGYLDNMNGSILFFGALINSNTYIHHIEEMVGVSYRYHKRFAGTIIKNDGAKEDIELIYRVRPWLDPQPIVYDFDRMTRELESEGMIHRVQLGKGWLVYISICEFVTYVRDKMMQDELYLLTDSSRKHILDLYREYGKPLTVDSVEPQR